MAHEILLKIGPGNSWKDGEVIAIKPTGYLIPGADMAKWINDDKEPAMVATMPGFLQRRLQRRIVRLRYLLTHTPDEISQNVFKPLVTLTVEQLEKIRPTAQHEKDIATSESSIMQIHGLDTNWGSDDLKHHAVLVVEDMTPDELETMLEADQNVDLLAAKTGQRRIRYKYEDVVDAPEAGLLRDKELRVDVNRVRSPLPETAIGIAVVAVK